MDILFTILIMVSVFAFGFFVVDLLGSPLDEDRRDRGRRPHGTRKSDRTGHPGNGFH